MVTTSDQPSRIRATVATKLGAAFVRDPAPEGAKDAGRMFGLIPTVQGKLNEQWSVGLGLDLSFSSHDTSIEDRTLTYSSLYLPVAVTRYQDRRFAASVWGGYYLGFRSITEPGGTFGTKTYASAKLHGGSLSASALYRVYEPIEVGPFIQVAILTGKEDDTRTQDFDENDLTIRTTNVGLMLQLGF